MTYRILTPSGSGAVAVIAWDAEAAPGPDLRDREGRPLRRPPPGCFRRARVCSGGRVLDDIVVLGTRRGVELHVHGGPAVIRALVGDPGGETGASAPRSLREARARISRERGPLAELERRARAGLAQGQLTDALRRDLDSCLGLVRLAASLARPPVVRIVGRPNAGKSTLFNALLGSERALTSPEAGTTRDTVRAMFRLEGAPIVLEDTAGNPAPTVCDTADLVVHLLAEGEPTGSLRGALEVRGKADLRPPGREVGVSGRTGRGIPELACAIAARLGLAGGPEQDVRAPLDGKLVALFERARGLPRARSRGPSGGRS